VESVLCFPSSLWESALFADFHSCGTFHSLVQASDRLTLGIKERDGVRPVTNAQGVIQMFVNHDPASGQCGTEPRGRNLKDAVAKLNRIVFGNDAFMLDRKDPIQIEMSHRHESRARLGRRPGE